MQDPPKVIVIIPAYNEEDAIGNVIREIPMEIVSHVIVVNNNSKDKTAVRARDAGATVLEEKRQGYGYACLKGMDYIVANELYPDIVVFIDGDYSDYPQQLSLLINPIVHNKIDMVIGSRALGNRKRGSMTAPQIFGNWLATRLIRLFYGVKYTDLGPFRAIRWHSLQAMNMQDKTYGWTVEMQLKAAKQKLSITEVPVDYRVRIGFSKVSGTVKGTVMAGYKIITSIFKYL
jgi:glycosyltransferase involved in cell wall biosynthesis